MTAVSEEVHAASEAPSTPRAERVAAAAASWADELAALAGRDPLLYFRDLKIGTLDLAAAEPEARRRLLDSESMPVSRLFPHEPLRSSALRTVRAIRDKARELADERGVPACMLAVGIATWANPFAAHRPTAPVLLRHARVSARDPVETDFVIEISAEAEINPVLLHAMATQLGLRFRPEDLRDPANELRYPAVVERLREFAPAHVVDGFSIAHRAVLGTFAREPLVTASDLDALGGELERNDVVAALAGDSEAVRRLRHAQPPANQSPAYVVLDADGAQEAVVSATAGGANVRVEAAPGTGRTQTIVNLVAELVGRGQRVLVVGQKRASLTDAVDRLARVGLGDLVLDTTRLDTEISGVRQVITTAGRLSHADEGEPATPTEAAEPRPGSIDDQAADQDLPEAPTARIQHEARSAADADAEPLDAYLAALHRRRDPWSVSVYELMAAVSATPAEVRTRARIEPDGLIDLGPGTRAATRARLEEYARLGGLEDAPETSPWFGADVTSGEKANDLRDAVTVLHTTALTALHDTVTRAAVEVGLPAPSTPAEAFAVTELLASVAVTLERFRSTIWEAPLADLVAATANRRWRADNTTNVGTLTRRKLRNNLRELASRSTARADREALHGYLVAAHEQLDQWRKQARDGRPPRTGEHLAAAVEVSAAVRNRLEALTRAHAELSGLAELEFGEVAKRIAELAAAEEQLVVLPRLSQLSAELTADGLNDLVAELRDRNAELDQVTAAFDYTWQVSLLEFWRNDDVALAGFDVTAHEERVARFRAADLARLREAPSRVLAARARRYGDVVAGHEGEATVVVESARTGQVPRSLRELVAAAPDVALAAVPCWMAAPLAVSGLLPPRRLFDVVVIEDAGTLPPAHAIPAVARGARVIVLGDDQEAVPSPTSIVVEAAGEIDGDLPVFDGEPVPSVFSALADVLPQLALTTGYRVRDHRLTAFVEDGVYEERCATVPGVGGQQRLRHELVGPQPDVDSSEAEVRRTVDLIIEHGRKRPHESLGVITLSRPHAARIEAALRIAVIRTPDVAAVLRDDREEPFFVKDVERVGGDVRDAVILSLGYGRSVDGRLLYRFGALDRPGGQRWLTTALTRARERLTLVSCYGADDLSPRRLITPGAQALREILAHVHSPGAGSYASAADPLALTLAARLRDHGASVVLGYGTGLGRIEIGVRHPTRRDRFVLAVLTDGPAYASLSTHRERDRLRPEQLSRRGWRVHRVWSAAWAADPAAETERLVAAYEEAVKDADAADWAEAAAESDAVVGILEAPGPASATTAATSNADSGVRSARTRRDAQPPVDVARPLASYTQQELASLAAWVESDGVPRAEDDVVEAVAQALELGELGQLGARAGDRLRNAVRVARAGAPAV